jgi:hypothetical protein
MDKWKLLRSALQGKRESDSSASIHRNDGIFSVIEKHFTAWGWTRNITIDIDTTLDALKLECHEYMIARDITELTLNLSVSVSDSNARENLKELVARSVARGYCRLKGNKHDSSAGTGESMSISEGQVVSVYWQDSSVTPFMPYGRYYHWTLSSGEVIHAR